MALFRRGMHFGSYGSVQNQVGGGVDSPMFEACTLLGALALVTTSARLFALVSPVTLRTPGLLAKAVTTLDVLSRGRAVLGVGAGWDAAEHEAYGIPFPGTGARMDRLDEALAVCRALFHDQRATVITGTYYSVSDAPNSPRPLAGTVPVLVAGTGSAARSTWSPATATPATSLAIHF